MVAWWMHAHIFAAGCSRYGWWVI